MDCDEKCIAEEWIGHWIRIIYRNITNIHNQKLEKYGLTTSQLGVLCNLWRKDGLTQKEIADSLKIRPASLTGLVNNLVSKKWVERRIDSEDARTKRLYLTEKGRKIRIKTLNIVDEMEDILGSTFTKEEKQLLLSWLKKLNDNLGQ